MYGVLTEDDQIQNETSNCIEDLSGEKISDLQIEIILRRYSESPIQSITDSDQNLLMHLFKNN